MSSEISNSVSVVSVDVVPVSSIDVESMSVEIVSSVSSVDRVVSSIVSLDSRPPRFTTSDNSLSDHSHVDNVSS